MWIEAPNTSTRRLMRKVFDDDGIVVDIFEADFNHNGRAEVTKKAGAFLLKDVPTLKEVKDGGPPPSKDEGVTAGEEAVNPNAEEDTTDGE